MTLTAVKDRPMHHMITRAVKAEWLQLRNDRGGHVILLVTIFCAIAWSAGLSTLLAGYPSPDANPSERAAVSGVFHIAPLGLFVWVARNVLREESSRFSQLKLLSMPSRPTIWSAKWICLTVAGLGAMLAVTMLSSLITIGTLASTGHDWQQFVGPHAASYLNLAGNTVVISVVSISFAVGISVISRAMPSAVTVLIGWVLVVEGMVDASEASMAFFYSLLPFKNATRVFEHAPDSAFLWSEPVSIVYSVTVAMVVAIVGIFFSGVRVDRSGRD